MINYGIFLKEERKARGISQEQLAKEIGISQAQISYYESGTNEPTIGICIRIADYYGITLDELFGKDNKKGIVNNIHHNSIVNINQGDK